MECTQDTECAPPRTVCEGTSCVPGCGVAGGATCGEGTTCSAATGRCEPDTPTRAPLAAACTHDGDCQSDVCFDFGGSSGRRCVESCGSAADCPPMFTCHGQDGARMCADGTILAGSPALGKAAGDSCSDDGECRSNLCRNDVCTDRCTVSVDCQNGAQCAWIDVRSETWLEMCVGPYGSRGPGATCNWGDECESGVCIVGGNTSTPRCSALCDTTRDCPSGTVCSPLDYSECTNGGPTSCNAWRIQAVQGCVEDNHGTGAIGAPCDRETDCRSLLCNPRSSECTDVCSVDADCPAGYGCKIDILFEFENGQPFYFNVCLPRTV